MILLALSYYEFIHSSQHCCDDIVFKKQTEYIG